MEMQEEYEDLRARFEILLSDLDRLQLPFVAVHVDLALRRLEDYLLSHEVALSANRLA